MYWILCWHPNFVKMDVCSGVVIVIVSKWNFITNHGLVLNYIFHNPSHTAREIADHVGVTERTTHNIIGDLEEAGFIKRRRSGRKNLYSVDSSKPLRHHTKQDILVSQLLEALSPFETNVTALDG